MCDNSSESFNEFLSQGNFTKISEKYKQLNNENEIVIESYVSSPTGKISSYK